MLSSFGIRAYRNLHRKFLALAFNNSLFIIYHGLGQHTYWRALEVGGMRGPTMCADAVLGSRSIFFYAYARIISLSVFSALLHL